MVSIAADGRSGMSVTSSTGTGLRAASVDQRVGEAVVQHGGVDAPGQGAHLGDRLDGPAVGVVDELGDAGQVDRCGAMELLLGQAQLHRQGHELRLSAIVQVPLDAAEPGGRIVHGTRPALLEGTDPLGGRTGAEQRADEPPVGLRDPAHQPRGGEHHGRADRDEQERAGEVDAGRPALPEHPPCRVGEEVQATEPAPKGDRQAEGGERQLHREVGAGPPGSRVGDPSAQPVERLTLRPYLVDRDALPPRPVR